MAVTIQVKFELSALWECYVAHMKLIVGPVLCDVPYQELESQEHPAAYWTLKATLCSSHAAACVWNRHIKLTDMFLHCKCMVNLSACLNPQKFWRVPSSGMPYSLLETGIWKKPAAFSSRWTTPNPTLNSSVNRNLPVLAAIFNTLLL